MAGMLSYHPISSTPDAARGYQLADRLVPIITRYVWSGIVWHEGHRHESKFHYSDLCVMDFDDGEMTLAEAVRTFCDCMHVIGTTRNHQKEKKGRAACDRFRVVIPWERRIDSLRVYQYNMQRLVDRYPIDHQALDGARHFLKCKEIVSACGDGYKQDVSEPPEDWRTEAPPQVAEEYFGSGVIPSRTRELLLVPAVPGTVRHTLYKIGAELAKWGFSLDDAIALARQSATATCGVMQARNPLAEITECVSSGWKKGSLDRKSSKV